MRPSHTPPGTAAGTPAQPAAEEIVAVDAPELFARYESSPEGLSGEEAHRRLRRYGPNELPSPRPPHPLRLLFSQVSHTLALLLWAAAALAFLAGLPQLGWAILAIIGINALFSFWQEYRAGRLVEALHKRLPQVVRVRRDGIEQRIRGGGGGRGALLLARRGDRVAAAARLVRAVDLRLDYSTLTGESEPLERRAEGAGGGAPPGAPNCGLPR